MMIVPMQEQHINGCAEIMATTSLWRDYYGVTYERSDHSTFHPGRSALLKVGGTEIGTFGELHPIVARSFELEDYPVLAAEFNLDILMAHSPRNHQVQALPTTPPVLEDIALVVPIEMPAIEVETVIRQAGGDILRSVTLFDVYMGDSIQKGHKSLAYSLVYQDPEKTLTDKQAAKLRSKIIKAAEKRLGAKLRA